MGSRWDRVGAGVCCVYVRGLEGCKAVAKGIARGLHPHPQVPVKGDDGKILRWDSKGIGILSVRKAKQDGAKPYIALFTESVGPGQGLFRGWHYC